MQGPRSHAAVELLPGREVPLSPRRPMLEGVDGESTGPDDTVVTRLLPQRHRRSVGAWCFVDHYGPDDVSGSTGIQVAPHPHMGLQTVSWLLAGGIRHRDSVGSDALVTAGALGLMTAGRGIAHSERSPQHREAVLHGVQLWVALPDDVRAQAPHFELHDHLPSVRRGDAEVRVFMGELAGIRSPATAYSPLVGAEVRLDAGGSVDLVLEETYEHAVVVVEGVVLLDHRAGAGPTRVGRGVLGYLAEGHDRLRLAAAGRDGARLLLLGGVPMSDELVMWWNFVGRSQADIELARKAWNGPATAAQTFGTVVGDDGTRMLAPRLPAVALKPRGRTG